MIEENGLKTVFGSLFHDIGKVIYRSGGSRKSHSESGYEYLKEAGIQDEKILICWNLCLIPELEGKRQQDLENLFLKVRKCQRCCMHI